MINLLKTISYLFVIISILSYTTSCTKKGTGAKQKSVEKKHSNQKNVLQGTQEEGIEVANSFAKPLNVSIIIATGDKAPSTELVALGKSLYFDTRLSKSNAFSCNSCHNLATYGVDNRSKSIGHNFKQGGRNAPTVLNAAFHLSQFWDGRAKDVEEQAEGPILNPIEMASPNEKFVVARLKSIHGYTKLFKKAYPNAKESITYKNMAKAIGAFERTLITPAPFDKYLAGDSKALSAEQKQGLALFSSIGCAGCHNGVAIGGNSYQKFGIFNPYVNQSDKGRGEITKNAEDNFIFKVPSLRNIEMTYPYFHDGAIWSLKKAVNIMAHTQLNKELLPKETDHIVAFLKSLTGEIPESARQLPILPPSSTETSHPEP